MDGSRFDSLTKQLSMASSRRLARRTAMRGLAAALLGGVVAELPVGRRSTSVLAGVCSGDPEPCRGETECCDVVRPCCPSLNCEANVCVAPPAPPPPPPPPSDTDTDTDTDKGQGKNKNKDDDDNDEEESENNGNGGNGGTGGNTGGDGIFWPCQFPWFANNPACNGQLGGLLGRG